MHSSKHLKLPWGKIDQPVTSRQSGECIAWGKSCLTQSLQGERTERLRLSWRKNESSANSEEHRPFLKRFISFNKTWLSKFLRLWPVQLERWVRKKHKCSHLQFSGGEAKTDFCFSTIYSKIWSISKDHLPFSHSKTFANVNDSSCFLSKAPNWAM